MKRLLDILKNKKSISLICTVLFTVLVGGYILAHLLGGFSEKLTITPATVASNSTYELYDAYIFRDETIITSELSGYRLDLCDDGEMAGIGTELARVFENEASDEVRESIELLDASIELIEKCCVTLGAGGISAARRVQNEGYAFITEALASRNAAAAISCKQAVTEAMYMLEINLGNEKTVSENIAHLNAAAEGLKSKRAELEDSLGASYQSLKAEKTGYYYSGADGYESIMSSNGISEMTLSEFYSAIESLDLVGEIPENAVGRMVYDPHWYAAVPVDMGIAVKYLDEEGYPKSGPYTVDFYNGTWEETELTLERVVLSPDDSRAVLLFSSSVMDIGFGGGRERRIRLHTGEFEGYRVPQKALREQNGESGVFVLTYGTVEWRRVEVIYRADSYVLVKKDSFESDGSWLALNDSIIVDGNDLYDGKTVD